MFNSIDKAFAFSNQVLAVRGYRQQLLASNIANADTPNYKAVDVDFAKALRQAQSGVEGVSLSKTHAAHLDGRAAGVLSGIKPQYRSAVQPSIDGNTVDMNIEQAQFSQNSLQYMAALQFMNGDIRDMTLALKGS